MLHVYGWHVTHVLQRGQYNLGVTVGAREPRRHLQPRVVQGRSGYMQLLWNVAKAVTKPKRQSCVSSQKCSEWWVACAHDTWTSLAGGFRITHNDASTPNKQLENTAGSMELTKNSLPTLLGALAFFGGLPLHCRRNGKASEGWASRHLPKYNACYSCTSRLGRHRALHQQSYRDVSHSWHVTDDGHLILSRCCSDAADTVVATELRHAKPRIVRGSKPS